MASLAGLGAGFGLAGVAGSTFANIQSASANARALNYEARTIEEQGRFNAAQEARRQKLLQGEANAITAASGLDPTRGSPLLMELDRVRQGAIEVQSISRAAKVEALGKRYGASAIRGSIPYSIIGGVSQGGSILTNYMMRRK